MTTVQYLNSCKLTVIKIRPVAVNYKQHSNPEQ